ncbi:MAG: hypothetical protein LUQ22_06145, partial [Methanotrichaceae archaeon]|nr:hypothetical protein [Methanotrichaceae archaeon]
LSDLESTMATVEQQDLELIADTKGSWLQAFEEALNFLNWSDRLIVEYNPAIWRISRYPVGLRLFSYPWRKVYIFEFGTPNSVFPFDCFDSKEAKLGVMLHEIAHFIDDSRWSFDLRGVSEESRKYVTREQRAELLAFCAYPQGIFEANKSMIRMTAKMTNLDMLNTDVLTSFAVVETLGRIGMNRSNDPMDFFREIEDKGFSMHMILETYISNYVFALAGLTTSPDLNESEYYGIKKSKDLALATRNLCDYLCKRIDLMSLEETLRKFNYKVRVDSVISNYSPLSSIDFALLNIDLAKENVSRARKAFNCCSQWNFLTDLRQVLEEVEAGLEDWKPGSSS